MVFRQRDTGVPPVLRGAKRLDQARSREYAHPHEGSHSTLGWDAGMMKPMTKWTPIALAVMLGGGALVFNHPDSGSHPVFFAVLGALVFFIGLLYGAIGLKRSLVTLLNVETRQVTGLGVPIATILIAGCAWIMVLTVLIVIDTSLDKIGRTNVETAGVDPK